jgi:hypothetical protein
VTPPAATDEARDVLHVRLGVRLAAAVHGAMPVRVARGDAARPAAAHTEQLARGERAVGAVARDVAALKALEAEPCAQ